MRRLESYLNVVKQIEPALHELARSVWGLRGSESSQSGSAPPPKAGAPVCASRGPLDAARASSALPLSFQIRSIELSLASTPTIGVQTCGHADGNHQNRVQRSGRCSVHGPAPEIHSATTHRHSPSTTMAPGAEAACPSGAIRSRSGRATGRMPCGHRVAGD